MFRLKKSMVRVSIHRRTLDKIFDECDRFDSDETGGRIIGKYIKKGAHYEIDVMGVIDAGPNATRTRTSFFQDGEYQEKVFRSIERKHPEVEHLGSWHTHHVNGLSTLSSGDLSTYHRVVNHDKHNTDFFYALLVVRRTPGGAERYAIRHYFVYRNDNGVYEIPDSQVHILQEDTAAPLMDDAEHPSAAAGDGSTSEDRVSVERPKDQEHFADFYPKIKPGYSGRMGALYWKGGLELVDGTLATVLVMERWKDGAPSYAITVTGDGLRKEDGPGARENHGFKSARHAVIHAEREVNREIFRAQNEQKR